MPINADGFEIVPAEAPAVAQNTDGFEIVESRPQLSQWNPTLGDRARQVLHAVRTSGPVETLLGRTAEDIAANPAADSATTTHDTGVMGLFESKTPIEPLYENPQTALEGVHNLAAGVVNSVASPGGIAVLPLVGPAKFLGTGVQRGLLGTFGVQGGQMIYEGQKDLRAIYGKNADGFEIVAPPDRRARTVMDVGNIALGGMMAAGGVHALKPARPAAPVETPAVRPTEDWLPAKASEPAVTPPPLEPSPSAPAPAPAEAAAIALPHPEVEAAKNVPVVEPPVENTATASPPEQSAPSRIVLKVLNENTSARPPVPVSLLTASGVQPEALAKGYKLNAAGTHYEFTEPPKVLTPEQQMAREGVQAMADLRAAKAEDGGLKLADGVLPEESAIPQIPVEVTPAEIKAAASTAERPPDVLDAIREQFPQGVKFDRADHGEAVKTARGAASALMSHTKGEAADLVLDGLHREGLFRNLQSVDDLAAAMKSAGDTRISARNTTPEARQLAADAKRTQLFEQLSAKERPGKSEPMPAGQLFVGDEYQLNGQPVRGLEQVVDAETGKPSHVTVEGAYGRQAIPADAVVHLNKGSLKSPGMAESIIAKLESLKFDASGKQLNAFGLVPAVWNTVISGVQLAVKGGVALKDAIQQVFAKLKASGADLTNFDEAGAREHLETQFGVRQFGEQLQANPETTAALKGEVTNTLYQRRPQELDADLAQRIVQTVGGVDQAREVFNDANNGLPASVRMSLGLQIIKGLDATGRYQDAANFFDRDFAPHTTDVAQGLAMLNTFHALSKDGKIFWAQKKLSDARTDATKPVQPDLDAAKTELERQNQQGIEHTTADPQVQAGAREAITDAVVNSMETHNNVVMELAPVWAQSAYILAKARELVAARAKELLTKTPPPVGVSAGNHLRVIMDDLAKRAADIATGHYQGSEPGVILRDKLVQRLGLSPDAAGKLAKALDNEFAKQVTKAKAKLSKRVATSIARKALGKRATATALSRSARDRYAEAAANNLVKLANKPGSQAPALQEFYQRLTQNLRGLLPKTETIGKAKLTDVQLIREALQNAEHYAEVWQRVGTELRAKYGIEGMADITNTLGELTPDALVEAPLDRSIIKQLGEMKQKLGTVVHEHWTKAEATKTELADKLVRESGLKGEAARKLAELIQRRFDALTTNAKRAALEKLLKPLKVRGLAKPDMIDRLTKLSNLGALSEERFYNAIRERMNLPEWSPALRDQLQAIAERMAKLPGDRIEARQKAQTEFMNAIERAKGVSNLDLGLAFYLTNILTGVTTHGKNVLSTGLNSAMTLGVEGARVIATGHPSDLVLAWTALGEGIRKGGLAARDVLQTGIVTGSRLAKIEPGRALELARFGERGGSGIKGAGIGSTISRAVLENRLAKFLNAWKYNYRLMAAEDLLFFKPAEEVKAALLAKRMARTEGLRGREAQDRARQMLGYGAKAVRAAEAQAAREGLAGSAARRRKAEILEGQRPKELMEDARQYALRTTFNNESYGAMGYVAGLLNQAKASPNTKIRVAANLVTPFTNIVSNVVNESLNYTPIGLLRAAARGEKIVGRKLADLSLTERADIQAELRAKALLGTGLLTAVGITFFQYIDDHDPAFAIYAKGPGNDADLRGWQAAGGIDHSIKIGGRYWSYANTPMALPMAWLGNIMDAQRDARRYQLPSAQRMLQDLPAQATSALQGMGKVILEQSFLVGLMDVASMMSEPNPGTASHSGMKMAVRTASNLFVPNAVRQVDKFFDPTVYEQRDLRGMIINATPFVRGAYGQPALNALGRPVQNPVSKTFTSPQTTDPLVELLNKYDVWPSVPGRNTTEVNGVPLSDDEFYTYVKARGDALARELSKPSVRKDLEQISQLQSEWRQRAALAEMPAQAKMNEAATRLMSEYMGKYIEYANQAAAQKVLKTR